MEFKTKYLTPEIKLSCYEDKLFKTEVLFDHHMLIWFISGETKIIQANESFIFKAGDIFLIPRNQLVTIINYPKDSLPHKTVAMHLSPERLRKFYESINIKPKILVSPKIICFDNHPLLQSCFSSLIPYFELQEKFPESIADLKINEAINILRITNAEVDGILGNFEEPSKTNLIDFMEKNFMFNMPMEKFGYLTGRSLSTFNRDFRKNFNTTPQKWLTQKRLELAHYQIVEKKKNSIDVYLEVGFENLSHFSYAFKKYFGYSPTEYKS
jgi:AraC-like DNA-binding protein